MHRLQNPGWFQHTHLRAINLRASTVLERARLSHIPAMPPGGLLGLLVLAAVGVVSGWRNHSPNRDTWMAWIRLVVAFLCSGLVGWLVATESPHLAVALVAVTFVLALTVGLLG